MMLHKDFGLEIKATDEAGVIEGYGSTFGGEPDSYGDVILPGAFAESLVRHKRQGTMPLMLWGHNAGDLPIGNWTDMAEDGKGLWVKGQIDLDDPVGQRVHRAMKRKSVRGLSIGYEVIESREDEKRRGVRLLEKLELWEISPVNFPANRRATVTGVKGDEVLSRWIAGDRPQRRELEGLLKDAFAVSNSEAERMANALLHDDRGGRDEPADPMAAFWAALSDADVICEDENGNQVSFADL